MSKGSLRLMPGTKLGKWTVGLIIIMPILFVIGSSLSDSLYAAIPSGETILKDITARPALALTMLAGMAAGVSGLVTGLVSILKHKDHAILVYLATLIGGLLTIYLAAEFMFPH